MNDYEREIFDERAKNADCQSNAKTSLLEDQTIKLRKELIKDVYSVFENKYYSLLTKIERCRVEIKAKDEEINRLYSNHLINGKESFEKDARIPARSDAFAILSPLSRIDHKIDTLESRIQNMYRREGSEKISREEPSKKYYGYLDSIRSYKPTISIRIKDSEERNLLEKTTDILSGAYHDEKTGKIAYSWREREDKLTQLIGKYGGAEISSDSRDSLKELINIVDKNKYLARNRKEIKERVMKLLNEVYSPSAEMPKPNADSLTIEDIVSKTDSSEHNLYQTENLNDSDKTKKYVGQTDKKEHKYARTENRSVKAKSGNLIPVEQRLKAESKIRDYDLNISVYKDIALHRKDPDAIKKLFYYLDLKKDTVEEFKHVYGLDYGFDEVEARHLREYLGVKSNNMGSQEKLDGENQKDEERKACAETKKEEKTQKKETSTEQEGQNSKSRSRAFSVK